MGYYSFVAVARQAVAIPDPLILLDKGRNVFTAQTDDLDGLLETLKRENVEVVKVAQLDGVAPSYPQDNLLLPGETLEKT